MKNHAQQLGFSLIETLVSVSLFVVIMIIITNIYSSVQKNYLAGSDRAEVTQNARVALDRMSREVRQAIDLVGTMPVSTSTATTSLEFQDGHDQTDINYIKYNLASTNLMRDTKYYYFNSAPTTHVRWYDLNGGVRPLSTTTGSAIIGEYFNSLKFYGTSSGIHVDIRVKKNNSSYNLETLLFTRN